MSRIDELIAEYCPDGVAYEALGKLVQRGANIKWSDDSDDAFRYIDLSSVDRVTHAISETETITRDTAPSRAQQVVREGDVIFGTTRPMLKRYSIIPAEYDGQIASTGYCVLRPAPDRLLTNFLFHVVGTAKFYEFVEANERGASYPAIPDNVVKKFRVPVPPLEVQREIVRILDQFTQLEAELEAELGARRRQYEHYRTRLLSVSDDSGVRWSTLGEISTRVSSGATPTAGKSEYYADGTIPWLRTQEVRFVDIWDTEVRITDVALKKTATKWIPADCVIVAISGATAGRSAVNRIPVTTNQHCCNFEIDPAQANYRYVFYWVRSQYQQIKALGQGARSDLNAGIIKGVKIPVPPIAEQERIVEILDKFDALVNDLSVGLPAELAARRKQYEFYRDRLLTFKERVA